MEIAFCETAELYHFIQKHKELISDYPMQIIPVKALPDWIKDEHRKESCIALRNRNWKCQILLVVETPEMKNAIKELTDILQKKRSLVTYDTVLPIYDLIGGNICTRVSANKMIKLYEAAVSIAQALHIHVPSIVVVEQDDCPGVRGQRHTLLDDDDNPIGDIITIVLQGKIGMLHTLAHEMRHCWQEYNTDYFYKSYKDYSEIGLSYMEQIEEIDADAYASSYLDSLGYNGIEYCVDVDEFGVFEDYLKKVRLRSAELNKSFAS